MHNAILVALQEVAGDDTEFILDLLDSYLASSPPLLQQLLLAHPHYDTATMAEAAHTLKSSSAMIGCTDLADRCATLEHAHKIGTTDPARWDSLVAAIRTAYPLVETAVTTLMGQLRRSLSESSSVQRRGFGLEA